jgi:phosphoserine phosphatase
VFRTVVFDCDSTLVTIEGVDELAGAHAEAVRALTDAAMDGSVALDEVYGRRLALIRPRREQVEALGRHYIETLVPGARETVRALRALGREVRILSGGLTPAVEAVAAELGLGPEDVRAVGIDFDAQGEYAGFDTRSPLARSGGKAQAIRDWGLERPVLLVGDGATDLEARPAVDAFAAYTGVVHRAPVAKAADYVIAEIAAVLRLTCDADELDRLRASPGGSLNPD